MESNKSHADDTLIEATNTVKQTDHPEQANAHLTHNDSSGDFKKDLITEEVANIDELTQIVWGSSVSDEIFDRWSQGLLLKSYSCYQLLKGFDYRF
jgi:hypothetical protein